MSTLPLVTVVLRAPVVSLGEAIAAHCRLHPATREPSQDLSVAWAPRVGDDEDRAFVGWGVAARVTGTGAERFSEVRVQAEHVWGRMRRAPDLPFAPRLFGGFAFDADPGGPFSAGSAGRRPFRGSRP